MAVLDFLLGRPLASDEDENERLRPVQAIPTFGLDALSSSAYGPEAALTILLPLGAAGLAYILPLSTAIIVLLAIVSLSYRQTIKAYPGGGGSYTVAKENLGQRAGLFAAAALMIDYLLNVAVGISAGIGALVSAAPSLQPHTLELCIAVLVLLTFVNLRGVREAGVLFMAPAYLFVGMLFIVIACGVWQVIATGGHPHQVVPAPHPRAAQQAVGMWMLLQAFASGCTALTGIEAVSNGVQAFSKPVVPNARRTLSAIVGLLIILLAGIAYLTNAYQIGATPPGQAGYQSVLSQLTGAVAGRGVFYFITMAAVLMVLCLSANTSFAGFPRLCRVIAADDFLPRSFANRGRRLVYSQGIWVLAVLAGLLLIIFQGITDRLIPLFAVGAFLAFTLSQAGMVSHWRKARKGRWRSALFINGIGAIATGATVIVVLMAKFIAGAWVVVVLVPAILMLMAGVHRQYKNVERQIRPREGFLGHETPEPIVVVPMESWTTVSQKALRMGLSMSRDVRALHVECEGTDEFQNDWDTQVEQAARKAGLPAPQLVVLRSPFRFVVQPIIDHVLALERENKDRTIAVVVPELVEKRWYYGFLHNQRGEILAALLLLKGDRRIVIVNVPWYLNA